ncbi:MAG: cation:proton antiporter [bacterium]|nr:cation:proton antiporter [bacterium]
MDIFVGISLTIVIAAVIASILQKLKQPLIIGHIITGLIVGPYLFANLQFKEIVDSLSQFGIALLLFIIGLNLSLKVIKEVGRVALTAGLGQIVITSIAGYWLARLLGFDTTTASYLGLALTFSSTIIIMKLLSDKKDLSKFYSKISIGLLLVQDLFVSVLLIGISAFNGGTTNWATILFTLLKGIFIFDLIALFTIYILPRLSASFAKSQEFLFLFSIAWGLGLATLFHSLGFSMEIGALVAGVTLSTSPYHFEISSKLRPLRDFFIILFFVLLGSRITLAGVSTFLRPALILSAFVIIIKPVIVALLTAFAGFKKKINFEVGVNFSQVSEFSLVLIIAGVSAKQISGDAVTLITLVSLITIAISSYLVLFNRKIYPFFQHLIFERKNSKQGKATAENYDVILLGCNRVGYDFFETFKELGNEFLVVDYDPEVIRRLTELGINCRYGDADDNEFLDELNLDKAKMVISSIPDFETNQFIVSKIRETSKETIIMMISHEVDEAIDLYEAGATYVITPHFLGGKYASMLISKYGFDAKKFIIEKEKHIKELEKRRELGHVRAVPES